MARNFTVKDTKGILNRAEAELTRWATSVGGDDQGWKGLWIPFQNQPLELKGESSAPGGKKFLPGEGSDLVILHAHGGGFIDGNAPSKVPFWLGVMKKTFETHKTKISLLSLEYSEYMIY